MLTIVLIVMEFVFIVMACFLIGWLQWLWMRMIASGWQMPRIEDRHMTMKEFIQGHLVTGIAIALAVANGLTVAQRFAN